MEQSIWDRLGVEPSGNSFNSLVQLETDNGIPRNPFINAGAIVIADILISSLVNPKEDLLNFIKSLSKNKDIDYSAKIAASEKSVGKTITFNNKPYTIVSLQDAVNQKPDIALFFKIV